MFMSDQLITDVKGIVDDIFKTKEESEMKRETEKALQTSANMIDELSQSLEAKDVVLEEKKAEILNLNESISDFETKITELKDEKTAFENEKEAFETEKADLTTRAEEAEGKIEGMEKDLLADTRLNELKEVGVAATSEKAIEDQTSKIREMSVEDFSSYKDELVAIREAIIAELDAKKGEDDNTDDANAGDGEDDSEEGSEEDDDDAASADDTSIDPAKAAFAALNMELVPGKDVVAKYLELGSQMANNIAERKEIVNK
jgi:chromosome segregation ATPase